MRDAPHSLRRALLTAVGGALFTAVLWTLITGDPGRGLTYGAIVLGVLLATAALERRRRDERGAEATARPQRRAKSGGEVDARPQHRAEPAAELGARSQRRQKRRRR